MNLRQQKYKKYRIEGYSAFASAVKAGYSRATAINATKNIERRCNFNELLEIKGITNDALSQHAFEGLNANKVISANITYGEADEKTNDFIEVPDWNVRHKYFETILKLRDLLRERAINVNEVKNETKVVVIVEKEIEDKSQAGRLSTSVLVEPS
jgi:phage terminase small subunit